VSFRSIIKLLFIIAALGFMSYYLAENWSTLKQHDWQFDITLFLLSSALLWLAFFFSIYLIQQAFIRIANAKISLFQLFRVFNIANLGRYLPGKIWNILGMYYLVGEYGISKKQTTIAILASEISYKGSALLIGICYFIFSPLYGQYLPVMITLLACSLIFIHPRIVDKLVNYGLRLFKKQTIQINYSYSTILVFFLLYIIVWMIYSLAFYVFVSSLTSLESVNIFQFFTILPLCWVVGYIMIFAPGGIGVREGMLVIILGEFLPAEVALVIAVTQRIWFTIVEGINIIISFAIPAKVKKE